MSSQEVKPQSIVHHIGRLGSKITNPIARRRTRMRMEQKLSVGSASKSYALSATSQSDVSSSQIAPESYRDTCSVDYSLESFPVSDDDSSCANYYTDDEDAFSCFSEGDEDQEAGNEEDRESQFDTVDQNEFLLECFLTNGQSDVTFLVHFFNEETSISSCIEKFLSIRILETRSTCECRRINSKSAPLFTAKLQIDPEQPTVVAIRNGKILSKVSDVASAECKEVDQWLIRTRILQRGNSSNDNTFSSLSTE